MAGCTKKSSTGSRKGSNDISGVRTHQNTIQLPGGGLEGVGAVCQDDSRVVKDGDRVYVITEYQVEEEQETEQPKCLAIVGVPCSCDQCVINSYTHTHKCTNILVFLVVNIRVIECVFKLCTSNIYLCV